MFKVRVRWVNLAALSLKAHIIGANAVLICMSMVWTVMTDAYTMALINVMTTLVTFLGLCRVHFLFSTCLLSLSHHVTNHPSILITWPITWLVTWPLTWPVTCHSSHLLLKVTCPMSPAPQSPAHHLILPHLISHDPIPTPNLSFSAYLSLAPEFSAHLLFPSHIAPFYDSY